MVRRGLGVANSFVAHSDFSQGFHNATGDNGNSTPVDETVTLEICGRILLVEGNNTLAIQLQKLFFDEQ